MMTKAALRQRPPGWNHTTCPPDPPTMKPAQVLLATLAIRLTVQKSLIAQVETTKRDDSLEVEDEANVLSNDKNEYLVEEVDNSLEVEQKLISLLLDKMILDTLSESSSLLQGRSRSKGLRRKLRRSAGLEDEGLVSAPLRRGRHRGGGRGRGDLIPYPRYATVG